MRSRTRQQEFKLLLNRGGATSAYAAYALAERFTVPEYWVNGAQVTPITALSGYSFTRSGTQGAVDASGAVQFFAANVPAINSAGYHAYGALTNYCIQSQTFETSWTVGLVTVTANSTVAPDGTTTGDSIVEGSTVGQQHYIYQAATWAAGSVTFSVFIKAGSRQYVSLRGADTVGGNAWITADLVGNTVAVNAATGVTGSVTNVANGWKRVSITSTANATTNNLMIVSSSVSTAPATNSNFGNSVNGSSSTAFVLWQAQVLQGNFPDGGPLIATTTAALGIGASVMSQTTNPILVDQDFIWYIVANFSKVAGAVEVLSLLTTAGHFFERDAAGTLFFRNNGVEDRFGQTLAGAGRAVVLVRRRSGKTTIATKVASSVVVGTESAVTAFASSTSAMIVGAFSAGFELNGVMEGDFFQIGTFSDAQLTTLLTGL